jgi:lipopolysaccharide export system protein LptA
MIGLAGFRALIAITAGLAAALPSIAAAQFTSLGAGASPLEINADKGIEWRRGEQLYIARGNASVARGDLTVYADVLTAHYRGAAGNSNDIFRIDAIGNVRIVSPNETAYAENGVYDLERGLLLLRGNNLKLVTQQDVILARDTLEYWDRQEVAVARGDASAVRGDREVKADVLTAYFTPDEQDQLQMTTLKADGNVRVATPREFARGNTGVYYVPQELMTLTGDVKVTRGEDQMNGRYAEVDLKTGISRMLGAAPGQPGDTRVRTLLVPGSDSEEQGSGEQGSGENATGAEGTKGKGAGKKSGS